MEEPSQGRERASFSPLSPQEENRHRKGRSGSDGKYINFPLNYPILLLSFDDNEMQKPVLVVVMSVSLRLSAIQQLLTIARLLTALCARYGSDRY